MFARSFGGGLDGAEEFWLTRFDLPRQTGFTTHEHAEHQLSWVAHGQLVVEAGGSWLLPPSQAVWIPAGTPHALRATRPTQLYCLYLWPADCPITWTTTTVVAADPMLRQVMLYLARPDLPDAAAQRARALLADLLRPGLVHPGLLHSGAGPAADVPMPAAGRARELAQALVRSPGDPRSLHEWAAALHVSEKTLRRAFVAETGMTFTDWRTQVRLRAALPLLADRLPVAAVAGRVGYRSVNGFINAFRRHFGRTPGSYATLLGS
ncbi:AraC family transcriptional regulator [Jiangella alkaliphila]|uniref:HTH-type transcriptional regulator RipA n=1 Tax=Jiangella alkaliphila TaxID=419479 RepID=A0A1H2KYR0_9ACTN|nr:AraC family transcriptional regulator [Jiangella alkaliphila]SDU73518.1 AraC-type DNA-binding protein [Jiangella alkaliphila]